MNAQSLSRSNSLWPHGLEPTRLLCPWDSPGKNTGGGCCFLLQGIFPAQRLNLSLFCLLHWQANSLLLGHQVNPMYTRYYCFTCWGKNHPICLTNLHYFTCMHVASVVSDSATLWTVACQTPLSMGFPRQEYWSGLSCPPPGGLPDSDIKLEFLISPALTGGFFTISTTWEVLQVLHNQP